MFADEVLHLLQRRGVGELRLLYSRLPDQLVNFSVGIQANRGDTKRLAITAEDSFRKARLFIAVSKD